LASFCNLELTRRIRSGASILPNEPKPDRIQSASFCRIVGWSMATTLAPQLVLDALSMALLARRAYHQSDN
jgi:hypothetical protein